MTRSLRTRLAVTHAAVAVIAIVVVGLVANVAVSRRFNEYVAGQQLARDLAVVQTIEETYTPGSGWDAQAVFAVDHVAAMNGVGARVTAPDGRVLFTAAGQGMMGMMGQGNAGNAGASGGMMDGGMMGGSSPAAGSDGAHGQPGRERFNVETFPVVVNGATVARADIVERVGVVLPQDAAYRRALNVYLVLAALLAGAIALVVSVAVSRRIAGPVAALTDAARQLEQGRLETRVVARGDDEIAELSAAFNRMAETLARQEEWRRTMTADLAHELRTPLATIQSRVEALEDGVLPATPENLRVIGEEVERLGRLLGELRSLNEVSTEGFAVEREPLDLAAVARAAAAAAEPGYARKGVSLEVSAQAVAVAGDRDRLRQVVANLLDNALKFTPQGGHVWLAVGSEVAPVGRFATVVGNGTAAEGGSPTDGVATRTSSAAARAGAVAGGAGVALLRVADDGSGIAVDDLPFVFERFYRAEGAKTSPGAGLGLAIVRSLVEAHGGAVEAAQRPGGGAAFTVRLPVVAGAQLE